MTLSGKSQNAFLFRMQKIHVKTSCKKRLLCHKCIVLYTVYLKFFTYSVISFLHKNVGNLLYDPCLLFKLPSRVQEMHHRQACRQHGEMESKLDYESAGMGWNPWTGHFTSLDFHFLLQGHQGPVASSIVWRVMRNTKPVVLMELYFHFHKTLWPICLFTEPAVISMRSGDFREGTTS